MKRRKFTARCQMAAGGWWAVDVPELRGVQTQARRLEKVEGTVRDAIALFLDIEPSTFDIQIEPVLPRDLQRKVGLAQKARTEADARQREAMALSSGVAGELVTSAHLTIRDAGRVLGLSHQRVAQLVGAAKHIRPSTRKM